MSHLSGEKVKKGLETVVLSAISYSKSDIRTAVVNPTIDTISPILAILLRFVFHLVSDLFVE